DKSAKKAWEWLLAHPQRVMVPATGAAKDNHWLLWDDGPGVESDVGARFIAAAEMWKTYRDPKALEMLRTLMDAPETSQWDFPYGAWQNLSRWGMITLAFDEKT